MMSHLSIIKFTMSESVVPALPLSAVLSYYREPYFYSNHIRNEMQYAGWYRKAKPETKCSNYWHSLMRNNNEIYCNDILLLGNNSAKNLQPYNMVP